MFRSHMIMSLGERANVLAKNYAFPVVTVVTVEKLQLLVTFSVHGF